MINLANEINAPSLLPSAFYDLSRYSYAQIFEHASHDDGTSSPLHHSGSSSSSHLTLSSSDMQKLSLGKEASQQAVTTLIQSMGNNASFLHHPLLSQHNAHNFRRGSCSTSAACRKDFTELVELATQHYLFDRERGYSDPLYVAEELGLLKSAEMLGLGLGSGGSSSVGGGECKVCAKGLEIWAARERERIWRLVPIWFRLEGFLTCPT